MSYAGRTMAQPAPAEPPDTGRRSPTQAEARALASPIRLRILRMCLDRALTNKEIAARLDANPATALHHVRTLVSTGFLAPQPERRGTRGAREVPYLATGRSWRTGGDKRRDGAGRAMLAAFLDEVRRADPATVPFARLGLRLNPENRRILRRRLRELLDEYADRPPDPDGTPYSLFVAMFRDVDRD
jgi:predicted ArsR family transcriptional regulator